MIWPSHTRNLAYGLFALAGLAIAVRLGAVWLVGSFRLDHVTYEHGEIARNLVEGRGFCIRWMGAEGPTSQQAPVYPALLAAFYWFFGILSPLALLAFQIFQAGLGGLLATCVALLGWELLPNQRAIGWLAGAGAAVYPTLVYAATQVQVASMATLLVVAVLWSASRAARLESVTSATGCGVAGGLLILTDPILGLVVMVAIIVIVRGCSRSGSSEGGEVSSRRVSGRDANSAAGESSRVPWTHHSPFTPLLLAAIAFSVCLAIVTPWIVRNYRVHGELVLVKSTFGYAFWQGNHPRSFGTDKIPVVGAAQNSEPTPWSIRRLEQSLWHARLIDTMYIDDAVLPNERIAELGQFTEPERSRQLMAEVTGHIRSHPWHYIRLCGQRFRYFMLFDETNPKSQVKAYRVSHLALLVLSLIGLWLTRGHARRLWPTYLVFALVTLFHTVTIVSARFHIPLEPMQILWAAGGMAGLRQPVMTLWNRVLAGVRACQLRPVSPVASSSERI